MFNFFIDCTYLSVSRRNAVGENSKIQLQLRSHFSACNLIIYPFVYKQYHMIVSGAIVEPAYTELCLEGKSCIVKKSLKHNSTVYQLFCERFIFAILARQKKSQNLITLKVLI